ncbi:hypothetical protein F5883DRAFT_650348 [Diaporthe sp. PMI_573]|nr:hypothetical protein F5883DRAFT_650348 [Diaporthaceae sp. PMI_573]
MPSCIRKVLVLICKDLPQFGIDGIKEYLLCDLKVAEEKMKVATEAWMKLHGKADVVAGNQEKDAHLLNEARIYFIGFYS